MKHQLTWFAALLVLTLLNYGAFAFAAWEQNPGNWNSLSRFVCVIIEVVIIFGMVSVYDEKEL